MPQTRSPLASLKVPFPRKHLPLVALLALMISSQEAIEDEVSN